MRRYVSAAAVLAAGLVLVVVAGCGAPTPSAGTDLDWKQLRSQGWPKDAQLALWLSPADVSDPGYMAFVDKAGKASFHKASRLMNTSLASSRGQLCVGGRDHVYRFGPSDAQRWPVASEGEGYAAFSSGAGCAFVFNSGLGSEGYRTDVVLTSGEKIRRTRGMFVPTIAAAQSGKVWVSNSGSSDILKGMPKLLQFDFQSNPRQIAQWTPRRFPNKDSRLRLVPDPESAYGLVRGSRVFFLESFEPERGSGPNRLQLSSVGVRGGDYRSTFLRTWRGSFNGRGEDSSRIGAACSMMSLQGDRMRTCDGYGRLWEIDPASGKMRQTGQLPQRVVDAREVVATASQASAVADPELTVLSQPGKPGDVVWDRYRFRDGKLLESRKITSLRPMLKSQKIYLDAVATIQ